MKLKLEAKNILPLLKEKFAFAFTEEQLKSTENVIRKGVTMVPSVDEEGVALIRASTTDVDFDDEVVLPEGIDTTQFMTNAPVCWSHDYNIPAIGQGIAVEKKDNDFYIKAKFAVGLTTFATEIWNLVKGKFVRGVSMGFFPMEKVLKGTREFQILLQTRLAHLSDDAKARLESIVTKCLLVELSICNMGKNSNALVMAVSNKSLTLSDETLKALNIAKMGAVTIEVEKPQPLPAINKPAIKSFAELQEEMEMEGVTKEGVTEPEPIEHNNDTADDEADWDNMRMWDMPVECYAFVGHKDRRETYKFVHHYMSGKKMLLHKEGLKAACRQAMYEVNEKALTHLKAHVDALACKECGKPEKKEEVVPEVKIIEPEKKAIETPVTKSIEEQNIELRKGITIVAESVEEYNRIMVLKSIGKVIA